MAELEANLTAREFAEWWAIWRWQPWCDIPEAPPKIEPMDPMAFADMVNKK